MLQHPAHRLVASALSLTVASAAVITGFVALSGATASGVRAPLTAPAAAGGGDESATVTVHSEPIPAPARGQRSTATDSRDGGVVVAELAPTSTPDYGLVAVTWDQGTAPADLQVDVRSRVGGSWTPWQAVAVQLDEGPAVGDEGSVVRDGTSPAWAGDADGVAVRVSSSSGQAPSGLEVVTVDSGTGGAAPATSGSARSSFVAPSGRPIKRVPDFPAMPDVVTRKQWGANESLNNCGISYGTSAKMVFIHHTVNSNDYGPSDGAAIVRSIHAYHTEGRGWCDIGYNFLVDRYGTIYEGRRGGMRLPVKGAHSGDYNTDTVGISLIGNFDVAKVPTAMKRATIRLVGWRLGTSYAPAKGMTQIYDTRFHRIAGHRDAMLTACPGRYSYAWLPTLRDRVAEYLSGFSSTIEAKRDLLGREVTGPVYIGQLRIQGGWRTVFGNGAMFAKAGVGTHWLSGRALRAYHRMHGTYGRLGFPDTDQRDTVVAGVTTVRYDHGRTYLGAGRSPKTLWGRVLLRYKHLGGLTGRMGLPTSGNVVTTAGEYASFEHGVIRWDRSTGKVTVVRS